MPFPIIPILTGAALAAGTAGSTYNLAQQIKAAKKQKAAEKLAAQQAKQATAAKGKQKALSNVGPISAPVQSGNVPAGFGTYTVYSPEQQAALNQVLQQSLGGLGKTSFDFAPIEQQARQGFAQKTVPSLAERFAGLGGGVQSSGFNQALATAGKDLESELAALRGQYNLAQQGQFANLLGIGLRPQYEAFINPNSAAGLSFGQQFGMDLLRQLATGENISGSLSALKNWAQQIQQQKAMQQQQGASLPAFDNSATQAAFGAQALNNGIFQPSNVLNPTSALGSATALYNPGNIVSGTNIPGGIVPGIGNPMFNPNMGLSSTPNVNALKSLYGL